MDREAFRDRYLDPRTSDGTVDLLRDAADGVAHPGTHDDLAAASGALAEAMQQVGLDRWRRFLADAVDRLEERRNGAGPRPYEVAQLDTTGVKSDAGGDGSPAKVYVAPNRTQWIGRVSVGDGERVALAKAATGAPNRAEWQPGELVKGKRNLPPGALIAILDKNGRYANATDGTSHAAIYLRQDEHGLYVIEQYNTRTNGRITEHVRPAEKLIPFDARNASLIHQGEAYRVVH